MNPILQYFFWISGLSSFLYFVLRFALKQYGKIEIEKYKNVLEMQTLTYKKDLEKDILRFKIKYTKLHLDQVEAIKVLYQKLVIAERSLEELLRPIKMNYPKTEKEIADEVEKNVNEFFSYFDENEIILNEVTCQIITKLKEQMHAAWKPYILKILMGDHLDHQLWTELIDNMQKAYDDNIQTQIPALKEELKKDFRKYLGSVENIT